MKKEGIKKNRQFTLFYLHIYIFVLHPFSPLDDDDYHY